MVRYLAACAVLSTLACSSNPAPRGVADQDEDAVAVGYGTQPRLAVTHAISSISRQDSDRMPMHRLADLIRARVPGVRIIPAAQGGFSIRLRGPSSLVGSQDALVVLDGLPLNEFTAASALAMISARDVVQIDVLKDAGATAMYGVRGTNGVIIIRTKQR